MIRPLPPVGTRFPARAFTLVEMLVAMTVLSLLVVMVSQLFSSAVAVTTLGNKRIDADAQARVIFDRMAVDFARMVKRADVDYFLKQPANKQLRDGAGNVAGNDQIAFYSEVPGYYPAAGAQSPVSLVAYRVNANTAAGNFAKVERLGKGLVWNGVSATDSPVLFLPVPLASPLPVTTTVPAASPAQAPAWPQAGNSDPDPHGDYELLGPQTFRFEYYYLLKGQLVGGVSYSSTLSDTPWDARIPGHVAMAGLQDVAAIGVAIAVLDPKSQVLLSGAQLLQFGAQLPDFGAAPAAGEPVVPLTPGALEAAWDRKIAAGVTGIPAAATKYVRVYHRFFYLNLPQ